MPLVAIDRSSFTHTHNMKSGWNATLNLVIRSTKKSVSIEFQRGEVEAVFWTCIM